MDAISYLIDRKWPKPRNLSLLLLAGTLVSWINFKLATIIPQLDLGLLETGAMSALWALLAMIAGLLAVVTPLVVFFLVPLFAIYRLTNTLHAWIRQRAVEEMICAGMTGREILNRMVWFGARWWLMVSGPSLLATFILFPQLLQDWTVPALLAYALTGAVVGFLGLYATAWSGFASGKVKTPLLGSLLVVQGVPALGLMLLGVNPLTLAVASVYVIVVARSAAIYALENAESLSQLDVKIRRRLRLKRATSVGSLSENPILARESMRGLDSADLISRAITVVCFAFTTVGAISLDAPWLYAFLIASVVLLNSYRAAGKMSQIVTEETENSTLETVRSAPISSDEFLKGWLASVLRTQWIDSGALLVAVLIVLAGMGQLGVLANGFVAMGICLCAVLPVAGAYIGASIAGQGKPRAQISGQLLASFGAVAVLGGPQMMATATVVDLPVALVVLTALTSGFCWLLAAGAKKSLNRVFLPQR